MDGKVIVVTGALGALGSVVVDSALARGARVASVDHAPTQVPATSNQFELGGVDLTDAAAAKKAIDAAVSHKPFAIHANDLWTALIALEAGRRTGALPVADLIAPRR